MISTTDVFEGRTRQLLCQARIAESRRSPLPGFCGSSPFLHKSFRAKASQIHTLRYEPDTVLSTQSICDHYCLPQF